MLAQSIKAYFQQTELLQRVETWLVKRVLKSFLNSFGRNVTKQVARFVDRFYRSLPHCNYRNLIKSKLRKGHFQTLLGTLIGSVFYGGCLDEPAILPHLSAG